MPPAWPSARSKLVDTTHTPTHVPRYDISPDDVVREIERLKTACTEAREVLHAQADQLQERLGRREGDFIRAQALMIDDPAFLSEVEQIITHERVNAEAAVARVMERFESMVASLDDQYLRERSSDIRDASRRILSHLLFVGGELTPQLAGPSVVVAMHLVPSLTVNLEREKILAFAAEHGGYTSHAAILARSLNIPAVTGLRGLTDDLIDGQTVIVDGSAGLIIVNPTDEQVASYTRKAQELHDRRMSLIKDSCDLAVTRDGMRMVTPGEPGSAGGDGPGVRVRRRGRGPLPHRGRLPVEQRAADGGLPGRALRPGGRAVRQRGRGVPRARHRRGQVPAVRAAGARGEPLHRPARAAAAAAPSGGPDAAADAGHRPRLGPRQGLDHVPMLADAQDLDAALELFEMARRQVEEAGHPVGARVRQGVMIEVPSAVPMLPEILERVDFGSVGTNDLVQYLLAADRNSERMAEAYDPFHPAVIRTLQSVRRAARRAGRPVSVCGEAASDPAYLPLLIGLGFRIVSVNVGSVPGTKRAVRTLSARECRRLARQALRARTGEEVREAAEQLVEETRM